MTTSAGIDRFEELLVPALAKMHRVALCLARNRAEAEDLVQSASLSALRGFGTFETGSNFDAWVCRIVSNEFFSRYRRARRRGVELPLDESPERCLSGEGVSLGWQATSRDIAGELVGRLEYAWYRDRDGALAPAPGAADADGLTRATRWCLRHRHGKRRAAPGHPGQAPRYPGFVTSRGSKWFS